MSNPIECQITFAVSTERPFIWEAIQNHIDYYVTMNEEQRQELDRIKEWVINAVIHTFTSESNYHSFIEDGNDPMDDESYLAYCCEEVVPEYL
jgi:hypothetical protein